MQRLVQARKDSEHYEQTKVTQLFQRWLIARQLLRSIAYATAGE